MSDNPILTEALRLAKLGYSAFPLRPKMKTPWQGSHGVKDATTDADQIRRWWASVPESNVGLACGGGLLVLDVDLAAVRAYGAEEVAAMELAWIDKPRSRTPSGGFHHFMRAPEGVPLHNSAGRIGVGVDLRTDGGYVVAPPSPGYSWITQLDCGVEELPDCPIWLSDRLRELDARSAAPLPNGAESGEVEALEPTPELLKRAAAYARSIPPAVQGKGGHAALLWAARTLVRGFRLPDDAAMRVLVEVYNGRCAPPWAGRELERDFAHKLREARRQPFDKPVGWLLAAVDLGAFAPLNGAVAAAADAAQERPHVVMKRGEDVTMDPVSWVWLRVLARGKVTMLVGHPETAKTTIAMDWAARLSRGDTMPDKSPCVGGPAGVVMASAEDGVADTLVPRFVAAGGDPKRISFIEGVPLPPSNNETEAAVAPWTVDRGKALEEAIRRTPDCRLVIIDPISAFMPGGCDEHRNADVRSALRVVANVAERTGVALLVLSHLRKNGDGEAILKTMGSLAYVAAARVVLGVCKDRDDESGATRLLVPIKNNLAPKGMSIPFETLPGAVKGFEGLQPPVIAWGEPLKKDADDAFGSSRSNNREAPRRSEAETFLMELLSETPEGVEVKVLQAEADAAGHKWRTIERAKERVGAMSRRRSEGNKGKGAYVWHLPGAGIKGPAVDR
ncbi:MAG: hypothetical protein EA376_11270 [Phycisphaeraceae bacterium]|nr:MAG: hypothetical protein EA376_11270 [Phycisphaeraceae bacterium]